ncbi:MAG: filamentous hemagglutinin family protein [Cellvibrionaceae bacterium]
MNNNSKHHFLATCFSSTLFFTSLGIGASFLVVDNINAQTQQITTARPTDRWKENTSGSYLGNLGIPVKIDNLLPQLETTDDDLLAGLKSGSATITTSEDGFNLIVDQDGNRLLAYWDSFNIGANNQVIFNQPNQDSVALNIIGQESPSAIFGSLTCSAACWLINPNGIFFGEGSQINTRGFIAAAMEFTGVPMDSALIDSNVTQWFERDNLFDGIDTSLPFLTNAHDHTQDITDGDNDVPRIIVQSGAEIVSNNATALLAGPEVINEGYISSEEGQVVLAGSKKDVFLALTDPEAKPTAKLDYRGFLVEVNSGSGDERGAVVNAGELVSNFGNVTLVASEIVQAGKIKSKTAVDVNGSIRLISRDQAEVKALGNALDTIDVIVPLYYENNTEVPRKANSNIAIGTESGDITIAKDSVMEITVDDSSRTATDADSFQQPKSQVIVEANTIVMEENSSIVAPSGEVIIRARENPDKELTLSQTDIDSESLFEMRDGSSIDVSGTTTTQLDSSRNTVKFFVTSDELKNSPEQKNGVLLRETVEIDIQRGTDLFDWTVALDNIQKTANERSATGGSVSIRSDNATIIGNNTTVDVSGGYVTYDAGFVQTTRLLGQNGFVDISDANPNDLYLSIINTEEQLVSDPKWGSVNNYRPGLGPSLNYREEYIEGKNAGFLTIDSPSQLLSDSSALLASVKQGVFQRQFSNSATAGDITLNLFSTKSFDIRIVDYAGSIEKQLMDQRVLQGLIPGNPLSNGELIIDSEVIERSGAKKFVLKNEFGSILQDDTDLNLGRQSGLDFTAQNIEIQGNIHTTGGDILLSQKNNLNEGRLFINGTIDTSGEWVNDTFSRTTVASRLSNQNTRSVLSNQYNVASIDAGDINLSSEVLLELSDTASFSLNAGAWLKNSEKLSIGKAGNIDLTAKKDGGLPAQFISHGPLSISALDGNSGGTLSFSVKDIVVADYAESILTENMHISNDFFDNLRLGNYSFTALNGNVFLEGTADINLAYDSLIKNKNTSLKDSGNNIDDVLDIEQKENYLNSPSSLTFSAQRIDPNVDNTGILSFDSGAKITAAPQSVIQFHANNRGLLDGEVVIAGGEVYSTLTQISADTSEVPTTKNYFLFGENAHFDLSAAAFEIPSFNENTNQERLYRLVDAGTLSLDAAFGFGIVNPNASILLRGKNIISQQRVFSDSSQSTYQDVTLPLAAGEFYLRGELGFDMGATVDFGDSGDGFQGGLASYRLDANSRLPFNVGVTQYIPLELVLGSSLAGKSSDINSLGNTFIFGDLIDSNYIAKGQIASGNLANNNTSRLLFDTNNSTRGATLAKSKVILASDINISTQNSVVFDTPTIDLNNHSLGIDSSYVQLGETGIELGYQDVISAENGSGIFTINAQLVDLFGDLSLSNVSQINISALEGLRYRSPPIKASSAFARGNNHLQTQADISISAPKIWGETYSRYSFDLLGADSRFALSSNEEVSSPTISFGSELTINADSITIASIIENPYGVITLNGNKDVTLTDQATLSVGGTQQTPFGRVLGDESAWIYNYGEQIDALTEKKITINSPSIQSLSGSVIDLSGGGSVYGREFIAGLGGTVDILDSVDYHDAFAIIPTQDSGFSPYDLIEFSGSNITWGTQIEISGSSQLASGTYTVLPANYALIEGAFLVTPESLPIAIGKDFSSTNNFGASIVAGRFLNRGSMVSDAWSGFRVEPGNIISNRANYVLVEADNFFQNTQPGSRPEENGRLTVSVDQNLDFSSTVNSSQSSPIGAGFDLVAAGDIFIGDLPPIDFTGVLISPDLFETINADSILVGGSRTWANNAWQIEAVTNNLTISDSVLEVNELVATATTGINIVNNSQISADKLDIGDNGNFWRPDDQSATLLISSTNISGLDLSSTDTTTAFVNVDNSSIVSVSGTLGIVFDGLSDLDRFSFSNSTSTSPSPSPSPINTRLQLLSENIIVGDTSNGAILSKNLIEQTSISELRANKTLSFNESIDLQASNVLLQADLIDLTNNISVGIVADKSIDLIGSTNNSEILNTKTNTQFSLSAPIIRLNNDDLNPLDFASKILIGSEQVAINAETAFLGSGNVELQTAGSLAVDTPIVGANSPTVMSINSQELLSFTDSFSSQENQADTSIATPGASFFFSGTDVDINTQVYAASGYVNIDSLENINIGENALFDLSSYTQLFEDGINSNDAGIFSAKANNNIYIADTNSFDFTNTHQTTNGKGGAIELIAGGNVEIISGASNEDSTSILSQGVDLKVQSTSYSEQTWDAILDLNAKGFNGSLDILATGSGENLIVAANDILTSENLRLATLSGQLTISGEIETTTAGKTILHGGNGVQITSNAILKSTSNNSQQNDLWVEAPNGAVNIDSAANFSIAGDVNIVKNVNDINTHAVFETADNISGSTSLFLSESKEWTTAADIQTSATSLIAQVDATNPNDFIASTENINVRPYLDIYSSNNLIINSAIDLVNLETSNNQPGILQLRSNGDILFNDHLNAAVKKETIDPSAAPTSVLLSKDSWSVSISAGNDLSGQYAFLDLLNTQGDIKFSTNSYLQTGTGDIDIFASGNIEMSGESYIASLGKADYLTDSFLGKDLPSWGDKPYVDLYIGLVDFSGFSRDGGNISIRSGGDLTGQSLAQTPHNFILRLSSDQFDLTSNVFLDKKYDGIRTWALASDLISGGIHAVGGGNLDVETNGKISTVGFSTPSLGIDNDFSDSSVDEVIHGGDLNIVSRKDITQSSFSNDGAKISVRSIGRLGNETQPIMLAGSDTNINLLSGRGISYASILNTFNVPLVSTNVRRQLFPESNIRDYDGVYFDGFDTTNLFLTSTTGDIYLQGSSNEVKKFLPLINFPDLYSFGSNIMSILPSNLSVKALDGNIILKNSLAQYPSELANIQLKASENILANNNGVVYRIPDISPDSLSSSENLSQSATSTVFTDLNDQIQEFLFSPFGINEHADSLIDRSNSGDALFQALNGSIGNDKSFSFIVPKPITVIAGQDIINTSFEIQHSQRDQISLISAGENISYPLSFTKGRLTTGQVAKNITIGGPGDLLVTAGGNIQLGASGGILSISNRDNPILPSTGANLHVYAGYNNKGNFKDLVGDGVRSNNDLLIFENLQRQDNSLDIDNLSMIGWLNNFLSNQLSSTINEKELINQIDTLIAVADVVKRAIGSSVNSTSIIDELSTADKSLSTVNQLLNTIHQLDSNNMQDRLILSTEALHIVKNLLITAPSSQITNISKDLLSITAESSNDIFSTFDDSLKLRIAASSLKEIALSNPSSIVDKGQYLFSEPELGETGFTSIEERANAKEKYFNAMGSIITLEYLLTPEREKYLISAFPQSNTLADVSNFSASELLTTTVNIFDNSNRSQQLLIAEKIMTDHTKQSSIEGAESGNAILNFERGYMTQQLFFGSDYSTLLSGMNEKIIQIESGNSSISSNVNFGSRGGQELTHLDQVFSAWGIENDMIENPSSPSNIDLVFSTIQSANGGNVNVFAPTGSINVGLAKDQLDALEVTKTSSELGIIAFGRGDINSVVADAFNVNESRAFSLSGGDLSLWSGFGDIDAGRGAKTSFSTPAPQFQISTTTGLLTTIRPPAVSGSGIRTSASRTSSNEVLNNQRRFYEVADGEGSTYLSTALGVVDAGEAGIQSAGDLFIAAAEVGGADNISVGGVSIGATANTSVGADVAGAGNVANSATDSVQESITAAASGGGQQEDVSAFITIELIDTGT